MALWNAIGDFLEGSGWTVALSDAGIASSGTADSFLKAAHLTRTGREAWQIFVSSHSEDISFEMWRKKMSSKRTSYWSLR